MRRITVYKTSDGVIHESHTEAFNHADKRYGLLLTKLGGKLASLDKYTETTDYLDYNLDQFKTLIALKKDRELENPEED